MRYYNIATEKRLYVKYTYLSNFLAMVERWNQLTVVEQDPEFLDKYNRVLSYGSITNGEYDNETDEKTRRQICQYGTWFTEKI